MKQKIVNEYRKHFIRFLKDNGAYSKFVKAFREDNQGISFYDYFKNYMCCHLTSINIIKSSLNHIWFNYTEFKYWNNLNKEYQELFYFDPEGFNYKLKAKFNRIIYGKR